MDHVLAYKATLYGWRTVQIKFLPFDFEKTCRYFKNFSTEDEALAYDIVGGIPLSKPRYAGHRAKRNNCFYYSAKLEEIMYGKFKEDKFLEGFVGKFDENGKIKDIIKYKNKTIIEKDKFKAIDNIKEISNKLLKFRNIIMSKDYFGILYSIFKEVIDFKNENMNDVDIFNSDIFLDLMDIAASYNQISIFKDIEKHLKD